MSTQIHYSPAENAGARFMGPFDLRIEEDGGLIKNVKIEAGYTCRDIEKILTKVGYLQGISYTDKIDCLSPIAGNLAYSMAVEQLCDMVVPERAEYIRVILLELNRVASHLFYFTNLAYSLDNMAAYQFCLKEREKYSDLFDLYNGSRLGFACIRVGGVAENATEGFLYRVERTIADTLLFLERLTVIFDGTPLFVQRLEGAAVLNADSLKAKEITGPTLRAAGIVSDIRERAPYCAYKNLLIKPVATRNWNGDALSRYVIRQEEIKQSIDLIRQAIKSIPEGNHNISIGADFAAPPGKANVTIESPRGEFAIVLESEGKFGPTSIDFSTPSTRLLAIAKEAIVGAHLDDIFVILAGLDISFSEVDK